jgi:hypothetical protein
VPLFPIAQAMGHKDTRMLERVYGRQTPEQLAALMARAMGIELPAVGGENCSSIVTAAPVSAGSGGPDGLAAAADPRDSTSPENTEARRASQPAGPSDAGRDGVPGGGIEPPTRGFSVPCSTD